MKKLQLKREVVEILDNSMLKSINGGGDTVTGDSGGSLCISQCRSCPLTSGIEEPEKPSIKPAPEDSSVCYSLYYSCSR